MCVIKACLLLLVIFSFIELNQCGRSGGGGRSRGGGGGGGYRGGYHSPSPSVHYSSSAGRPRPSPSTSYHPTSRPYSPPRSTSRPYSQPRTTSRPYSPPRSTSRYEPVASRATSRPVNQYQSTRRSGVTPPPTQNRPATFRTTARPRFSTAAPARYPTVGSSNSRTPSWDLPPRPGQYPQGPPRTGSSGYQGPKKVVYVNKYNYHYPGYYSLPQQHYSYPGYYHAPVYHYSSHDTGSTVLGLYLGYSLARLTTPTYSHYSFYDGYRPRYDHYTVHHYYHNKESVPQNQEIRSNAIVGCVGDSTTICPANTVSLCTTTGTLMCVVNAAATVPCSDNQQLGCIKSTISCVNNTAPECKNTNTTTINIPCVSTAKVFGDIKYVNNTIVTEQSVNSTNTTSTNTTSTNTTSTNTTITPLEYSTKYPITTTPTPEAVTPAANITVRKRREAPQNFCVTILAQPAEKKVTEGEKFYEDAKEIASKFFESAWGL